MDGGDGKMVNVWMVEMKRGLRFRWLKLENDECVDGGERR